MVLTHNRKIAYCVICGTVVLNFITLLAWRAHYIKVEWEKFKLADPFDINSNSSANLSKVPVIKPPIAKLLYMRSKVSKINKEQAMYNEYLYGIGGSQTSVIVIQVHDKIEHLKQLLESLKLVTGIQRSLLIFSHDFYDDAINTLIQSIEFSKFMQIFYPYTTQLYPNIFPGKDASTCTDALNHCTQKLDETPGERRDPDLAQMKHSWWWTMNHIFDYLDVTKYYNDYIIFLEEGQYVAEDLIFVIKLLSKVMPGYCSECSLISVGAHAPSTDHYKLEEGPVAIKEFGSTFSNMGLAFKRSFWDKIKSYQNGFCYYKDYSWVKSLKHVAMENEETIIMFSLLGPRVFHIGDCDFPRNGTECSLENKMKVILSFLKLCRRGLYPQSVDLQTVYENFIENKTKSGWNDVRDYEFCLFMSSKRRLRFNI